jgi:predicted transcriptional regulator of viral defense system
MIKTISLRESIRLTLLNHHPKPVIALHEFHEYIYALYREKTFDEMPVGKIKSNEPEVRILNEALSDMLHQGILLPAIEGYVWQISNRDTPTAQQQVCDLTPYSHLSYLSAMEWHGLTDRIPHVLHVTQAPLAAARKVYQAELNVRMPGVKNLSPLLPKGFTPWGPIDGKTLIQHTKTRYRSRDELHGSGGVRVTNLGETFLDMLREPDHCGGYAHVEDIFRERAAEHLPVIVRTVEKEGSGIDRARTGYMLEEVCGLSHRTIDKWKTTVQRGGSRKLVSSNPYKNVYSEVWCISLNN